MSQGSVFFCKYSKGHPETLMRDASQRARAKGPREPQFMFLTFESIKEPLSRRADHDLRPNEVLLCQFGKDCIL